MKLSFLNASEFAKTFAPTMWGYNSVDFSELNLQKCENIHYLSFADSKIKFGLILGEIEGVLKAPFSAPFGDFLTFRKLKISDFYEVLELLKAYAKEKEMSLEFTFPPSFYNEDHFAKMFNALFCNNFKLSGVDLNFHMDLSSFSSDCYSKTLETKGRQKLKNALQKTGEMVICKSEYEIKEAYDIIKKNREFRGYPLWLSLDDISKVSDIIKVHVFMLKDSKNKKGVASAFVYQITKNISQVVYWGNLPEDNALNPTNALAFHIGKYLSSKKVSFL